MAITKTLHVRAVPGRKLPAIDALGRPLPGQFVGYAADGSLLASVSVPADAHHVRALRRKDLETVAEAAPSTPEAPPAEPAAEPPAEAAPSTPSED